MKQDKEIWLTVKEGYNLLGISQQAMAKRIKAQKYTTKTVQGNGGLQYRILLSSLPQSARDCYFAQQAAQLIKDNPPPKLTKQQKAQERAALREQGMKQFALLPKAKQQEAKQKQLLVQACQQHIRENGFKRLAGLQDFCQQVNSGDQVLHEKVVAAIPMINGVRQLNPNSFKRWLYEYEQFGLIALANQYGRRAGQSKIEQCEPLKRYVLGFILRFPYAQGRKIKQAIEAEKPELNLVSEKSINRYIEHWKTVNAQTWTYITHPDKWKSVYMSAQGSHFETVTHLNALWEMDSTPGDWLLEDGRHVVIGCIDLYSRRMMFYVSKSSTAEAVCRCFRKAVLAWGVPDRLRTDNGKDYVSGHFSQALIDLEIPQELCVPFASEEKGTIERHLGTMSHGILEMLPGFAGHNVTEAQQLRSMKSFSDRMMTSGETLEVAMTGQDLQEALDRWAVLYSQTPHSGLNGKTPMQQVALYVGAVHRISDERALDMLLAEPAGKRTVSKKGIRFNGFNYIAPELTDVVGKAVHLRYDEQDMGRLVVMYDGRFVCIAKAPELTCISRQEVAIVAKKEQKRKQAEQAKELKQFKKEVAQNIPELVIEHRIEQSDNVHVLPKPSIEHSTNALEEAKKADRAHQGLPVLDVNENDQTTADEKARQRAEVIELLQQPPEVNFIAMNDAEKWRHWNQLHRTLQAGGSVTDKELSFYNAFQNTRTFEIFSETEKELGAKG